MSEMIDGERKSREEILGCPKFWDVQIFIFYFLFFVKKVTDFFRKKKEVIQKNIKAIIFVFQRKRKRFKLY